MPETAEPSKNSIPTAGLRTATSTDKTTEEIERLHQEVQKKQQQQQQQPPSAANGRRRKKKGGKSLRDQSTAVVTGVKFENKANSKVVLGVRQSKTVSGIRFDPKTHKQITHVFKEAAPLEAEFAALSLEELKAATKQLVAEIKQQKKGGASAEKLGQLKQRLKEMKRAQDDKT